MTILKVLQIESHNPLTLLLKYFDILKMLQL